MRRTSCYCGARYTEPRFHCTACHTTFADASTESQHLDGDECQAPGDLGMTTGTDEHGNLHYGHAAPAAPRPRWRREAVVTASGAIAQRTRSGDWMLVGSHIHYRRIRLDAEHGPLTPITFPKETR